MTLREAISQSFEPQVWQAVENYLSPPELLKVACLAEFVNGSAGPRIDFLRKALIKMNVTGLISLSEEDNA